MRILRKNVSQTISLRTAESKIAARVKQKDPVLMAGSINVASLRCWPTKGTASTTKAMAIRICLSRGGNCLELITVWAKREDVDWASRRISGPAGLPTCHIVGDVQPTSFRRCFERLGSYQHSYPMDADALARIRGNVRRAFAASVYVALLERILLRRLLCFEFTRHYLADHVMRHRIG